MLNIDCVAHRRVGRLFIVRYTPVSSFTTRYSLDELVDGDTWLGKTRALDVSQLLLRRTDKKIFARKSDRKVAENHDKNESPVFGRSVFRLLHPNRGARKQNQHKTALFKNRLCAKIFVQVRCYRHCFRSGKVKCPVLMSLGNA